ncbi:MAG: DUF456 domain-containing protein [Chloroflexi bacterium]|nr:DUF456 domain-containing protein [Chloroflexota bacterium]
MAAMDFAGLKRRLLEMEWDHWSIEAAAGCEATLRSLFEARNVPDDLQHAYEASFTNSTVGLHEHYQEMLERGEQAVTGFVSKLKGTLAELRVIPSLEEEYPEYRFDLAGSPVQPEWDIHGVGPGGQELFVQVKVGGASYAPEVVERIREAPQNIIFTVTRELHQEIAETHPELVQQMSETPVSNLELTEDVQDNLEVLGQNFGIDVPDDLGDILPYVGEIVLGIRLLWDIIIVERDFKGVDLKDRQRMHALKAIMLLSRFGVTTVLVNLGVAAGSLAPGPGTIAGAITGAAAAALLNRRLKPRMLAVAMRIAGVDGDDLFYLRNKHVIDGIGASLTATRVE